MDYRLFYRNKYGYYPPADTYAAPTVDISDTDNLTAGLSTLPGPFDAVSGASSPYTGSANVTPTAQISSVTAPVDRLDDPGHQGPCSRTWTVTVPYRRQPQHQGRVKTTLKNPIGGRGKITRKAETSIAKNGRSKKPAQLVADKIHVCMRCRYHKLKCIVNPDDPKGPCLTCAALKPQPIAQLPCMRLQITDVALYRAQVGPCQDWTVRWPTMEMRNITDWASEEVKSATISHGFVAEDGAVLSFPVQLRQFTPQPGDNLYDEWYDEVKELKRHYIPPYAFADMHQVAKSLQQYISVSVDVLVNNMSKRCPHPFWEVYVQAHSWAALSPRGDERTLLRAVLSLWAVNRMTSRPDWFQSGDKISDIVLDKNAHSYKRHPLPPVVMAQGEIIMSCMYQQPLTKHILRTLTAMVKAKKKQNWYALYLALFVLLHSCSKTTKRDEQWARHMEMNNPFANPSAIAQFHIGSLAILAHFHHMYKGALPLATIRSASVNELDELAKLAGIDIDRVNAVRRTAIWVSNSTEHQADIRQKRMYSDELYFVSQLFETEWSPVPIAS